MINEPMKENMMKFRDPFVETAIAIFLFLALLISTSCTEVKVPKVDTKTTAVQPVNVLGVY